MKRFLVASAFLSALLVLPSAAHAQTGGVRGRVIDEKGQGIADALVSIDYEGGAKRKFEVHTDKRGEYLQIGLQVGPYKLTASKEGLQTTYIEEKVTLGDPTVVHDLQLVKPAPQKSDLGASFAAAANLLKAGDLDGAEAAFNEILAKHPALPEGHYNLGIIHSRRKDFTGAQAEFQKAIDIKPEYTDGWIALAQAYQSAGDHEKALATMKEASAQNADDANVQFSLGIYFMNAQQLDEAETAFKKAQTLNPANAEVLYHLATITLNKGDTPGAIALLEKYVASGSKNAQNMATAQQLIAALKPKK